MVKKKQNVVAGNWYGMRLRRSEYVPLIVARYAPSTDAALVYVFDACSKQCPVLNSVRNLSASSALTAFVVSADPLADGLWPLIGKDPDFSKEKWPMPWFLEVDPLINIKWRVKLNEDDLMTTCVSERLSLDEGEEYTEIGICGRDFAKAIIKDLLK